MFRIVMCYVGSALGSNTFCFVGRRVRPNDEVQSKNVRTQQEHGFLVSVVLQSCLLEL